MPAIAFLCLIWIALARLLVIAALSLISAWLRRSEPQGSEDLSKVTIVIPARNEANVISDVLAKALESVAHGASLVVVDDGSIDETATLTRQAIVGIDSARIITLPQNEGKAVALNRGIAEAVSPYILTIDADTFVDPNAVGRALTRLESAHSDRESIDVVAFDVSVLPSPSLFSELQGIEYDAALNFERRGQSVIRAVSVAPGAASLWRTKALRQIDGFSNRSVTEDVDATMRLAARGQATAHVSGAVAWTDPPHNLHHLLAQRRRWCLGHYQNILRQFPRRGNAATYTWLVYPNFFFLSAFLPALGLTGFGMLLFGTGEYQQAIWISMMLWLPIVYTQRFLGLLCACRRSTVTAFVLEPFTTSLLHMAAVLSVILLWLAAFGRRPLDPWEIRE